MLRNANIKPRVKVEWEREELGKKEAGRKKGKEKKKTNFDFKSYAVATSPQLKTIIAE